MDRKVKPILDSIDAAKEGLGDDSIFSPDWELCVHHYVAAAGAVRAMGERQNEARTIMNGDGWAKAVHLSFGAVLRDDLPSGPWRVATMPSSN